jgi:hypothetical protein
MISGQGNIFMQAAKKPAPAKKVVKKAVVPVKKAAGAARKTVRYARADTRTREIREDVELREPVSRTRHPDDPQSRQLPDAKGVEISRDWAPVG